MSSPMTANKDAPRNAQSLIGDLERVLTSGQADKCVAIMRSVTDLFLTAPTQLTDDQVSLFDDVITKLIERLESKSLAELSERLADQPNAPPQVVHRLASDNSIGVAGPVLARSDRLSDEHLAKIAETKSQEHLGKIAGRRQLSPAVTDVLVDRGDRNVIHTVAANSGASFSKLGMSALAMRADGDDELIETISRRTDVPSLVFAQLLSYATDQTRARLLAARPASSTIVEHVLTQVSAHAGRLATIAKDWATTQSLVDSFGQDTELTRMKVLEFADGARVTELVAALSVLSGIPTDLVGRLVCDQSGFGLMILCKSISLDWSIAHAVLGTGPNAEERAKQIEGLHDDFERLSVFTARRLLGFWQGRVKTRAAFDRVRGEGSKKR